MKVLLPMLMNATMYMNPHVAQGPPTQTAHASESLFEANFTGEEAT